MFYLVAYFLVGAFTGYYFHKVNKQYFSLTKMDWRISLLIGFFWPFGLPTFLFHYRREIRGFRAGRDWADDNIPFPEWKERYRALEKERAEG